MTKRLLLILVLVTSADLIAQVKLSGYTTVGYSYAAMNQEIEYTQQATFSAKVLLEYELNKHIQTKIDFRAGSSDKKVKIVEVSVNLDYFDRLKFMAGNIKKPFSAENIESIENLSTVGRSYLTEKIIQLGYGGRSIGLEAYYKYSRSDPDFPYSYYLFAFRDDGKQSGFTARLTRVVDNFSVTGNYFLLKTPGTFPITTQAAMVSSSLDFDNLSIDGELFLGQDPNEGIKRIKKNISKEVYVIGGKISSSLVLPISSEIIQAIQPLFLISYYQPDSKIWDEYTVQFLAGTNLILDPKVKFRINTDLLLSKNPVSKKFKGHDARIIINLIVKF